MALRGFLLMVTRQGKLLYLSENATDYLAHSVEEIMSQGDSLYDLVDQRDHVTVQAEILSGPPSISVGMPFPDKRIFMCRMNMSRTARRQVPYHKFVIIHGHYLHPAEYYQDTFPGAASFVQPVFAAFCVPLVTPENSDLMASGNTSTFCSIHNMDLKFVHIDDIGLLHLGYSLENLLDTTLYKVLHPDDLPSIAIKHKLLCDDKETCCILLLRLQNNAGNFLWAHTVFVLKEGVRNESVVQLILVTYQMLSEIEAATLKANLWIYSTPQRLQADQISEDDGQKIIDTSIISMTNLLENSDMCCVSIGATPPSALPPSHVTSSNPTNEREVKPKRKYVTQKVKKLMTSQQNDKLIDSQQIKGKTCRGIKESKNAVKLQTNGFKKTVTYTMVNGSKNISPPSSAESTEDDRPHQRGITVEIPPLRHPAPHHVDNLASVLTPETSPADGGFPADGERNCRKNKNLGPDPVLAALSQSPLPVIEPLSLEAYLQHVESEGCLPVFGLKIQEQVNSQAVHTFPGDFSSDFLPELAHFFGFNDERFSNLPNNQSHETVGNRLRATRASGDPPPYWNHVRSLSWCAMQSQQNGASSKGVGPVGPAAPAGLFGQPLGADCKGCCGIPAEQGNSTLERRKKDNPGKINQHL